jgi:hypothetical protein
MIKYLECSKYIYKNHHGFIFEESYEFVYRVLVVNGEIKLIDKNSKSRRHGREQRFDLHDMLHPTKLNDLTDFQQTPQEMLEDFILNVFYIFSSYLEGNVYYITFEKEYNKNDLKISIEDYDNNVILETDANLIWRNIVI